jgi:hypothetical protein
MPKSVPFLEPVIYESVTCSSKAYRIPPLLVLESPSTLIWCNVPAVSILQDGDSAKLVMVNLEANSEAVSGDGVAVIILPRLLVAALIADTW